MVDNKYTKAVDQIDVSRASMTKVLSAVRQEETTPSEPVKPKMKPIKKVLLISAAVIVLVNIGVLTASAFMGVNLYMEVYRFFDESINPKYVESYEDVESTSGDITVKVTDAVSDGYRTMVRLDIYDPEMERKAQDDDFFMGTFGIEGAALYDEFGNRYEMSGGSGGGLGTDEPSAMVLYFEGGPEFACEMHLFITGVNGVKGGWDMKFTVTPHLDAKKYKCDTVFEFDTGMKLRIDRVEQYITRTVISGTYLEKPDFEKYGLGDISLMIGDNEYGFRSLESSEEEVTITLEAVEENIVEPELSISLGNDHVRDTETKRMKDLETKRIKLHLTEE